jgi:dCMP deaminase
MSEKEENKSQNRISKENYYLDIAQTVAKRSTCLRKKYGAIIVKNDSIVATGYNGAPRGRANCCELGSCMRDQLNIPRGERYEMCRAVHAEANAIIDASRDQMIGATLYMVCLDSKTGELVGNVCSCMMCKRMLINADIREVIIRNTPEAYTVIPVQNWITDDDSLSGKFGY